MLNVTYVAKTVNHAMVLQDYVGVCASVCLDDSFGDDCGVSCADCENGAVCGADREYCECTPGWTGVICNESKSLSSSLPSFSYYHCNPWKSSITS